MELKQKVEKKIKQKLKIHNDSKIMQEEKNNDDSTHEYI